MQELMPMHPAKVASMLDLDTSFRDTICSTDFGGFKWEDAAAALAGLDPSA